LAIQNIYIKDAHLFQFPIFLFLSGVWFERFMGPLFRSIYVFEIFKNLAKMKN